MLLGGQGQVSYRHKVASSLPVGHVKSFNVHASHDAVLIFILTRISFDSCPGSRKPDRGSLIISSMLCNSHTHPDSRITDAS